MNAERCEDRFRAVVFRRGDWLIAQCLEHNIVAQAREEQELLESLFRTILGHVMAAEEEGMDDPFSHIPPAPARYFEMFEELGLDAGDLETRVSLTIERPSRLGDELEEPPAEHRPWANVPAQLLPRVNIRHLVREL